MEIDILIEDFEWFTAGIEDWSEEVCPATLRELGLEPIDFEVSILACDDTRIAVLNAQFLDQDKPTNVLSWPARNVPDRPDGSPPVLPDPTAEAGPVALGDIAIAYGVCQREAAAGGKTMADHARHLLVHAVLHLLGYDHIRDGDAALMQSLETRILARLCIADPY